MDKRRKTRGQLSSIELLPREASDIVVWAAGELAGRARTQLDIYVEFKTKLIALQGEQGLAFPIPAFSSFNRYSTRQAALSRALEEFRMLSTSIADRLDGDANEDVTKVAVETLKMQVLSILSDGRAVSPKEVKELSQALLAIVGVSMKSDEQRSRWQAKFNAAAAESLDHAETVAKEAGVSAEHIAQMRREFLGVRPPAAKAEG